ncbi:LysR family transcriptional regulator [Enterobacter sp. Cy-643]|uniref:LysR family transcriptional regulator n=1 Tax=Enterobacter sp. Cy-643 TaxID=2608346 RepID=UPI00196270A3|nr:LysR family transcriptional regulator [Enterobacter sp. Cy-643]
MHSILRRLDMNLLLVFDALYRYRSVTEAAGELALSPSALSHALNRLRESLGDPLFVRSGKQMAPTAKAESIAAGISAALSALSASLATKHVFEPRSSSQTFTFAVTDYTAAVVMPGLIARVNRLAPGIAIRLVYSKGFNADEDLLSGKVDFALGFEEGEVPARRGIESFTCFTDDYRVAVRRQHPTINQRLTPELYLSAGHVVVRPWPGQRGAIDRYLESQGLRRHIAVELPSLMIAPPIVSQTDLAITLPQRGISTLFDMQNLAVFTPPFPMPSYTLKVYFGPALSQTPGHLWMREQINALNPATSAASAR